MTTQIPPTSRILQLILMVLSEALENTSASEEKHSTSNDGTHVCQEMKKWNSFLSKLHLKTLPTRITSIADGV